MELTALDWWVIAGYSVLVLGVGLLFAKRAGRSPTEYFASGRAMPWWLAGTSMVATTFAADTPLAVTGLVAKNGLAGNWVWWALALGGMFAVFVYARLWRRAGVLTDVELVELRYGGRAAAFLRVFRALYVALLVNAIIIGWVVGAMITVLENTVLVGAASELDAWLVVLGMLVVVGTYSTLSGMWGVAVTDVVQFVLAMAGCVALAVIATDHVGGVDALRERVTATFGGDQAFAFIPDFGADQAWMTLDVFLLLLFVQWWATWYPGAEPGGGGYVVQRMASCRSERDAQWATLWYQIAHYCVRPWPWLMVAFAALALHPEIRSWALDDDGATNPGAGFPIVMRELAPPGLRGLLLVAFGAAFMSTISTQMNWGASYLVTDVYRRFLRPTASDAQLARVARWASVIVLVVGIGTAWLMRDLSVDEAWKLLLALGAGTGAVFMLRWFWWRINVWSEIAAMGGSLLWFVVVSRWVEGETHRMALVAVLTIVTWLVATMLTRPERPEVLLAFFRRTRPGGPGWGPQRRAAPDVECDQGLGRSVLAAFAASGIVFATIPAVGAVIFGAWAEVAAWGSVAVACAVLTGWVVPRSVSR
ncbi:MAG: sodium:solute symporter family protein [Planctomycetota bacterium]